MANYTNAERASLRAYMGYSKLFSGSNSIFENILDEIQDPSFDGGITQANSLAIVAQLQGLDTQIANNSNLGLATMINGKITYDAYRNDRMLRSVGRALIKQLSIMFSMRPAQDYYSRATASTSGNIYPVAYDFNSDD